MWPLFNRHLYILHKLPTELENFKNCNGISGDKGTQKSLFQRTLTFLLGKSHGEAFNPKTKRFTWKCNFPFAKICFCPFPPSCQLTASYGNFLPNKLAWKKAHRLVLLTC